MTSLIDRFLDAGCRVLPNRVLRRFLYFLSKRPALTDRAGFHVRPRHFYEPLPDFAAIDKKSVMKRRQSRAVDWNFENQRRWLDELAPFKDEIKLLHSDKTPARFDFANPSFSELDAAVYYATVRRLKPARIIEVGSGYSTQIACRALQRNAAEGRPGSMTCIEPYPAPWLHGSGMDIQVLARKVETVDLDVFRELTGGDILFIDSTHTVKFQSDVCREILDILPELAAGVHVHVHDIFFPFDYPPAWLISERRAWNEQYLLEAFLAYNAAFEVVLANHLLAVEQPSTMARLLPHSQPAPDFTHRTGSFWMRRRHSLT